MGNAGTAKVAQILILILKISKKLKIHINKKIDLIIIGPEKPLVEGIVDYSKNLK